MYGNILLEKLLDFTPVNVLVYIIRSKPKQQ